MSREKIFTEEMKYIHVYIEKKEYDTFKNLAYKEKCSLSEFLRRLVKDYNKKNQKLL